MTAFAAVLLALIFGVTELLPVSGSGHLYLFAELLGLTVTDGVFRSFRAMLLLGTAFAGVLFYRTQLLDMTRETLTLFGLVRPRSRQRGEPFGRRLGLLLLVATGPLLPALLLNRLRLRAEQGDHTLAIVCALLCVSGVVLYFAARGARAKRSIHQMTLSDALLAGLAQVLTVFPGLSRTGLTLAVLLGRGLDGAASAEFSGLMSVPALLAGGLWELISAAGGDALAPAPFLILAFALSALSGFFALRLYTERMSRHRPTGFAYWCWGAAILTLLLFLISA